MTGIDHAHAPVTVRERFSYTSTEKAALLEPLSRQPGIEGCILVSTCNRTELWVCCEEENPCLWERLCRSKNLPGDEFRPYFTDRSGEAAVSYLFAMTSGLKSRIIGEDQILAQVKKALDDARSLGVCGSILEVLFRTAVTGAKKVKTELSISTANASAVELAIAALCMRGVQLQGKQALVIGNGEMGRRAAAALIARGAEVTVTIRQYRSGIVEVVPGCTRINYADRYQKIPACDLVVSATSSPNITLHRQALEQAGVRPGTVFIDLAVPRDIDPAVKEIPDCLLWDIDSFSVPQTEELTEQLARAEVLLARQQTKFVNWLEGRDQQAQLEAIRSRFCEEVVFRMGASLKSSEVTPELRQMLTEAVQDAAGKEVRKLLFTIRDEGGADCFRRCIRALTTDN